MNYYLQKIFPVWLAISISAILIIAAIFFINVSTYFYITNEAKIVQKSQITKNADSEIKNTPKPTYKEKMIAEGNYYPKFKYEYSINGNMEKKYTSYTYRLTPVLLSPNYLVEEILDLTNKDKIKIYLDPRNPKKSVIIQGIQSYDMYYIYILLFFVFSTLCSINYLQNNKQSLIININLLTMNLFALFITFVSEETLLNYNFFIAYVLINLAIITNITVNLNYKKLFSFFR